MIRSALLTLPATLLLTACGNSDTTSSSTTASTPKPQTTLTAIERGAQVYRKCRTCHTLGEGEPHKVGPNLWAIFGAKAGAREDFNYSKAMAASDITWSDETMDAYLLKPSQFIKGGRMSFVGLKKPEDRAAVIAYLREETTPKTE